MKCRFILPHRTLGMLNDVQTYQHWFPDNKIYIRGESAVPHDRVDINFYMERPLTTLLDHAKINILMCNYEFLLFDAEEAARALPRIDYIICKTRIAEQYCRELAKSANYSYQTVYTRHTTKVDQEVRATSDTDSWVHVGGTSPYKNTDIVLRTWLRHPEWPQLYFVCTGPCEKNLERYFPDYKRCTAAKNIVNLGFQQNLAILQQRVLNHVCPSMVEGYGHYINEARAYSRFIVTTDYAPMNELVTERSGILTKCSSVAPKRSSPGVMSCIITEESLTRDMQRAFATPLATRKKMGAAAHRGYLADTKFFRTAMTRFVGLLKTKLK